MPEGFATHPAIKAIDQAVCALEMQQLRIMPAGWEPHVKPAPDLLCASTEPGAAFHTVSGELLLRISDAAARLALLGREP